MSELPDRDIIDQFDRFVLDAGRRQRLEANDAALWRSLLDMSQAFLVRRAWGWSLATFKLPSSTRFDDDPALHKWVLTNFVEIAFVRFRQRCLRKPEGSTKKGGVPPGSPARYVLSILHRIVRAHRSEPVELSKTTVVKETGSDTFHEVLRRERLARVRHCIDRLPEDLKSVIELEYFICPDALKEEKAAMLGTNRNTFWKRQKKALDSLLRCLNSIIDRRAP